MMEQMTEGFGCSDGKGSDDGGGADGEGGEGNWGCGVVHSVGSYLVGESSLSSILRDKRIAMHWFHICFHLFV